MVALAELEPSLRREWEFSHSIEHQHVTWKTDKE